MKRFIKHTIWALMSLFISACLILGIIVIYFELQLPNINLLKDVQYQTPLRIYSKDHKLLAQYGEKRRIPITINTVPKPLINAILATEDQRYYEHPGVDPMGLLRAAMELIATGTKSQGGSTITMQVARNFFLTREKTYSRKFKEILLAIKIDSEFSKQKILELYLNKIYLGNRAYGVAAAAQVYYGKALSQLTLPEMAMLAGLPKAPSSLNPIVNPKAALERRNHVLERMYERHYITKKELMQAIKALITASYHEEPIGLYAPYVAEMVYDAMMEYYGDRAYTQGFNVYTTINAQSQNTANESLSDALIAYDKRHGYRGPEENWGHNINSSILMKWRQSLEKIPSINDLQPAVVLNIQDHVAEVLLSSGAKIIIPWDGLKWAFKYNNNLTYGVQPKNTKDILSVGDLIRVQKNNNFYSLAQIPQVEGALVSLNPENGAILALTGGFNYKESSFNRAEQAARQPGSSFKPFIYAAALAKGYTLASTMNDAPIVVNDPTEETLWRPQNDTKRFYGPTRLRVGLVKSRNLVSIRLLQAIGIPYAIDYVNRFGFDPNKLPHTLSLALGTGVVSPLELARGYAIFANGGFRINPYLIDHITSASGKVIYQAKPKFTKAPCILNSAQDEYPIFPGRKAPRIISAQIAYLINSALGSVITQGTGAAAKSLNRQDIAGKTGTTNEQMDAWFSGFNGHLVTTCWVGFDQPQSLHEYGAQAALPMWIHYMQILLHNQPECKMSEPPGIVAVKIDPTTGLLAQADQENAIFELFRRQYAPHHIANSNNDDNDTMPENWSEPLF